MAVYMANMPYWKKLSQTTTYIPRILQFQISNKWMEFIQTITTQTDR